MPFLGLLRAPRLRDFLIVEELKIEPTAASPSIHDSNHLYVTSVASGNHFQFQIVLRVS